MSATTEMPVMVLPQLFAGTHIEKCDCEENESENQHENVLHLEPSLVCEGRISGNARVPDPQ